MEESSRDLAELRATVRALGPYLEQVGAESERLRTLAPAAVERLRAERLFWLKTPAELGGSPIDPLAFSDVIEELAYFDASAAWTVMIGNGATGMVAGWLEDDGAKEVFSDPHALPIVAGQAMPRGGSGRRVNGGIVATGRYRFSSGIAHANWLLGACMVEDSTGPTPLVFVVPRDEVAVHDTWFAAGLQGSGSADFSIEECFVPAARTYLHPASAPVKGGRRGGALFRQPQRILTANELPPFCVGVARRALVDAADEAAGLARGLGATRLRDRATFQRELALCETRVRAAHLVYRDAIGEAWQCALDERECPEDVYIRAMVVQAYVSDVCLDAALTLFRFGGGRFLSLEHPMQRHVRNLLAARQHIAASDESYEIAGRLMLGIESP